jgi:hypothetical protein
MLLLIINPISLNIRTKSLAGIAMVIVKVQGIEILAEYLKARQKKRVRLKDFVRKAGKKHGQ